jgi:2-dehydropantoate 2-reductase
VSLFFIKILSRMIILILFCAKIVVMEEINNIVFCGIGAIGSIYAEKIQNYENCDLKVLVDKDRLERYTKNPICFNGKELKFNYILPDAKDFKADLIIIATKFDGLEDAIHNIKNFVKENTIIMSLLNGVTSEDIIAKVYGKEKLLYSYVIGHSAMRNGRNIIHDGVNKIVFGSKTPDNSKVKLVSEFFDKTNINYEIPKDIIHSLWLKYLLNVSSNQTSAILRMNFGQMQNNKKCIDFISEVAKEVSKIAKAEGVQGTESFKQEFFETFNSMTPEGKTSMLQDVEAKRKTEVDMFASTVIEFGQKHNIETPYNKILKELIEITEAGY